jgi:hypothetical protein
MLRDTLLWTKIGRICARLSERLEISPERAFHLFYESDTCEKLHDEKTGLYLMSDLYIVDDMIMEIQRKQG